MESESGAKIAIRGKGSVKEGKGRSDAAHTSNQEEDLHCLIMADTEDKVNKAKKLIHNVIETAASIPEGQNELKRNQLRELAALNGTLRDDENQACQNCGEIGHRKYDCPQKPNYTANIICRTCGQAGHMARDCAQRRRGTDWRNEPRGDRNQGRIGGGDNLDDFLNEMGGDGGRSAGAIEYNNGGNANYNGGEPERSVKPWERGQSGGQAPWARNSRDDRGGSNSAAAPWASASSQAGASYGQGSYDASATWMAGAGYGGYGGYGAGYDQHAAAGAAPPGVGYGYGAAPPGVAAGYGYGNAGSPPPPPPGGAVPPPPPSEQPPPPPPSEQPPPPPPN